MSANSSKAQPSIDVDSVITRELAEARKTLQFVERWANHHGVKPHVTPAEALGVIQHHPDILEITDSYADGKRPTTRNPYAELAEAKARAAARIAELEALVELYRRQGADQDARAWLAMSAECEARGQEIDRLRAEVEALRADAERWKWRKENPTARLVYSCGCYRVENWTTWYTSADDAVDAAISAAKLIAARKGAEGGKGEGSEE